MIVLFEERLDLFSLEGQLERTQTTNLIARDHQDCIWEAYHLPRRKDQVTVLPHELGKAVDEVANSWRVIDELVIIQHQDKVFGYPLVDLVDQGNDQALYVIFQ